MRVQIILCWYQTETVRLYVILYGGVIVFMSSRNVLRINFRDLNFVTARHMMYLVMPLNLNNMYHSI